TTSTTSTSTTKFNPHLSKFYNVIIINKKTGKPLSLNCFFKDKPTKFRIICIKGTCAILGYQIDSFANFNAEQCITIDLNCYDLQFNCSIHNGDNCY
ncbi:hypothetical protein ABES30_20390, partial [Bacillus anthracis]